MKPPPAASCQGLAALPARVPQWKTYAPLVAIVTTHIARRRLQGRKRFAEFKQRQRAAKKHRGDQLRFYEVPLLDSEIDLLIADLRLIERADDKPFPPAIWNKLVGLAIAAAARSAIKNNR